MPSTDSRLSLSGTIGVGLVLAGSLAMTPWLRPASMATTTAVAWLVMSLGWVLLAIALVKRTVPLSASSRRIVIAVALVCIGVLTPIHDVLSDDVYRYIWDGWITTHGVNPYAYAPVDDGVQWLRTQGPAGWYPDIVTFEKLKTIYPPGAEAWFALSSSIGGLDDVLWKIPTILCVLLLWAVADRWAKIRGARRDMALLILLSPVVLLHGVVDAHVDIVMTTVMIAAMMLMERRRLVWGAIVLGLAASIKLLPLVAIPMLWRKTPWLRALACTAIVVITLGLTYVPFLGVDLFGSLGLFAKAWSANSLVHTIASALTGPVVARRICLVLFAMLAAAVWWYHRREPVTMIAMILVALMITTPVLHPWYVIPLIALLPFATLRSSIVLCTTISMSGLIIRHYIERGVWFEHPAWLVIEFVPVFVALWIDMRRGRISTVTA